MALRFIHTGGVYGNEETVPIDQKFRDSIEKGTEGLYVPKHSSKNRFDVIVECMLQEFVDWNNSNVIMRSSMKNYAIKLRIYQTLRYLGYMINCDSYHSEEMTEYDARELNKRLPFTFDPLNLPIPLDEDGNPIKKEQ